MSERTEKMDHLHVKSNEIKMVSLGDEKLFPEDEPLPDGGGDLGGDGRLFRRGGRVNPALVNLRLFDVNKGFGEDPEATAVLRLKPVIPEQRGRGGERE